MSERPGVIRMLAPVQTRQAALEARFPRWQPRTLDAALDAAAEEFPDRPYVMSADRTYTYREIQQWSVRIATGLVAAGVRPGDRVALVMANYPDFVAVKFGISRAGATAVPINFLNRRDELGYVLNQSDASVLITMDRFRNLDYLSALDELAPGWVHNGGGSTIPKLRKVFVFPTSPSGGREGASTVAELGASAQGWQPVEGRPDQPADILYTSGTTGSPKGVILTHDMLVRTAYGSAFGRAFQDARRIVFSLPMYHVYGYVEGMLAVLFVGGAIVAQLSFDAAATLQAIAEHRADDVLLIPTMTMTVLDELRAGTYDVSSLTSVISSGGQSPAGIWAEIDEWLQPEEVTTGYGMSETTASTTVTRPDDPFERRLSTNGRLRVVGVAGDPELGQQLAVYKVVDPASGVELVHGEVGELLVRGPGVTPGYYNKPEENAAAFDAEGWLRTGDLGRFDDDDYLVLVGRKKDCYRCGGEQVVPKEIEDVLTSHPEVLQAHVVPIPDRRMGEVGVAWVVLRPGPGVTMAELTEMCAGRLARFKVPKHILVIEAQDIPVTPSGRPRKFLLVERALAVLAAD